MKRITWQHDVRNRCTIARLEKNATLFNVLETTESKTNEFVY